MPTSSLKKILLVAASVGLLVGLSEAILSTSVPFLFWTSIGKEECSPAVSSYPGENILEFTSSDYLRCLEKQSPDNVIIFVLDELDVSDFSVSRDDFGVPAFRHLQDMLRSSPSVVLPSVKSMSFLPHVSASLKNSFKNAEMTIKELPPLDRGDLRELAESVSHIDDIIQKEISLLTGSYVAVLTAELSPETNVLHETSVFAGRRLLATVESAVDNTTFVDAECILLNFKSITLYYSETYPANLTYSTVTQTCGSPNASSVTLEFDTDVKVASNKVTLKLSFVNYLYPVSLMNWWNITAASVTHALLGNGSTEYSFKNLDTFTAPANWSWVCGSPEPMTFREAKDKPITQRLVFETFQIQAFVTNASEFSRALDCSGFLTAPIWMGTVVSLILAMVLAFGFAMIAGLSTMDRFDDPRGKSIIVQVHEVGN